MAKPVIACVGDVTIDVIGSSPKLSQSGVATFLDGFETSAGGRGGNFAAHACDLGLQCHLFTGIGSDYRQLSQPDHVASRQIDTQGVYESPANRTPRVFVFADREKYRMYFDPGVLRAESESVAAHAAKVLKNLVGAEAVYCTSWLGALNVAALEQSRAPIRAYAPGHEVSVHKRRAVRSALRAANLLFLNHDEYDALRSRLGFSPTAYIAEQRGRAVVVTRGAEGAHAWDASGEFRVPPADCRTEVIDPTGAGDAFAAAVVFGLIGGWPLARACELGAVAGAIQVEAVGAFVPLEPERVFMPRCLEDFGTGG